MTPAPFSPDNGATARKRNAEVAKTVAAVARKFTPAQWSVMLVSVAVLLGLTPRFAGVGWFWSLILLAGGWVIWRRERGLTFVKSTFVASPWFMPVYAGVVVAQAWQMLTTSFISLLWTLGAILLCVGVVQKAKKAGETAHFDGHIGLVRGYGQYITLGVGLCGLSLLMKWDQTPGFLGMNWTGGFHMVSDYNYYTHSIESHMDYVPMMYLNNYYLPGFKLSGRSRPFVLQAEFALLALLGWAAFRRTGGLPFASRDKQVGFALAGFVLLWWINAARGLYQASYAGPLLFFVGTLLIGAGVFFRAKGQTEGPFDLAHLWRGVLSKRGRKP